MLEKMYKCISMDEEWIGIASEAFEVCKKRRYYASEEKRLLSKLKELSDNRNSSGGGYMFIGTERHGIVNYKMIPELKEIDLDLYRKEDTTSWKLSKI